MVAFIPGEGTLSFSGIIYVNEELDGRYEIKFK